MKWALTFSNVEASEHNLPGPPDDLGASSQETPKAQEPADAVQFLALAVSAAHALDSVASSESNGSSPSSALQETLVADLA